MKKQKISDAVIHRLPRYYRYLDDLYNKGVVRISSNSLGAKMDESRNRNKTRRIFNYPRRKKWIV